MENKKLLYALILFVSILFLIPLVVADSCTDTTEGYSFLCMHDIVNRTYMKLFENGANANSLGSPNTGWWLYNSGKYNSINNMDFSKDFWMPIQPWEYEVCSRGLSTQLTYENGAGLESVFSGIYDDTVTVAAYKRIPERNANIDSSMLYEVSWYFHPANTERHYNVILLNTKTMENKTIQSTADASAKTGASGYVAFYSVKDYDKVVLRDESTPKEFTFIIIATNDTSR